MKIRHKDCLSAHGNMVKDMLTDFELLQKKYDINPEDFNLFRNKLRYWSHKLQNYWHSFFTHTVDAKFAKKINENIEEIWNSESQGVGVS